MAASHSPTAPATVVLRAGPRDSADISAALLGIHPYLRLALHDQVALWGVLGYGLLGEAVLHPSDPVPVPIGFRLYSGALGGSAVLLPAAPAGGFELRSRADGLLVAIRSEAAVGIARADADVMRLRLLLQASYRNVPLLGGALTPELEVGVRYDDGAAERGFGLVLGGSLDYALPAWGLSVTANGRALLLHQDAGFREWSAGGALRFDPGEQGRGLALRVSPAWGGTSTGPRGLWELSDLARLASAPSRPASLTRLDTEVSYGLDLFGSGVVTPYVAMSGTPSESAARSWRVGSRMSVDPGITLDVEGVRREQPAAAPEYTFGLHAHLRY